MNYYIINTDANSLGFSPHDVWIEQGLALTGGSIYYGRQLGRLEPDDICFMYVSKRGIVAVGRVLERWNGKACSPPLVYSEDKEYRIRVMWFLDLRYRPVGLDEVRDIIGIIPPRTLHRIANHANGEKLFSRCLAGIEPAMPDEVSETDVHYEGAVKRISVNAYERNPQARQKCIEYYGLRCAVCNHTLDELYGVAGKGLIHVHHLRELSNIGKEYQVDPIEDLRPVCPNCHAIIHTRKPAYSIEEAREFYMGQHSK